VFVFDRIKALTPPFAPAVATELGAMMPAGVEPIALFRTFAKNLPMTRAMQPWGRYQLGKDFSLSPREREIVIDRTCARCGCQYEWGVHITFFAQKAAFTPAQVLSLTHGDGDDPCWESPRERVLLSVVDALHDACDIDDGLWGDLTAHFDQPQVLDILLLCGWYHAISFTARAARIPLEPGAPTFDSVRTP
jgi:alkylhydroperoxidase family enzyme